MSRTRHIGKRMSQRGITGQLLEVVSQFGVRQGDKVQLNKKGAEELISHINLLKKSLMQIAEKGGLVLVDADGTLITTYRLDSYDRRRV